MTTAVGVVKCCDCGVIVPRIGTTQKRCDDCRKAYLKAYQKAYQKTYQQAYRQTPEYKTYDKARKQTPEYKAHDKARRQSQKETLSFFRTLAMAGAVMEWANRRKSA